MSAFTCRGKKALRSGAARAASPPRREALYALCEAIAPAGGFIPPITGPNALLRSRLARRAQPSIAVSIAGTMRTN